MKKLLFLVLIVFLFSCEKPKEIEDKSEVQKFCWTCEFYYPHYTYNNNQPKSIRKDVCDKTEGEIRSYEKEMAYNGAVNAHTVTCWRKY